MRYSHFWGYRVWVFVAITRGALKILRLNVPPDHPQCLIFDSFPGLAPAEVIAWNQLLESSPVYPARSGYEAGHRMSLRRTYTMKQAIWTAAGFEADESRRWSALRIASSILCTSRLLRSWDRTLLRALLLRLLPEPYPPRDLFTIQNGAWRTNRGSNSRGNRR